MEQKLSIEEIEVSKVVITVLGKDTVGIIAGISGILAEDGVNILDISQTILQDIFTMVMICDIGKCIVEFSRLKEQLEVKGKELGVQVQIQREDVFRFMHRI